MTDDQGNATVTPEGQSASTEPNDPNSNKEGDSHGDSKKSVQFTAEQQSELDRRVQDGVKKAVERALRDAEEQKELERQKLEKEKLEQQGQHQKLNDMLKKENDALKAEKASSELKNQTIDFLNAEGIPEMIGVFDADISNIDGRKNMIDVLKPIVSAMVDKEVQDRIKTPSSVPSSKQGKPANGSVSSRYQQAIAEGDTKAMIRLSHEIANQRFDQNKT
jgi:hypothetical protein